ncbi:hypothetical protein POVCU2_0023780 [Plasmodium ovale curtisi]|uniref:Uncharacterized protein n=1 Tax=Plasmodium ovale curtisi TaxID=864141 RepID=A0A1A8VTV3_PLAOA|nr:hypothetical protein POVCU2_0023780 [Plasmodium ovale curtisi]
MVYLNIKEITRKRRKKTKKEDGTSFSVKIPICQEQTTGTPRDPVSPFMNYDPHRNNNLTYAGDHEKEDELWDMSENEFSCNTPEGRYTLKENYKHMMENNKLINLRNYFHSAYNEDYSNIWHDKNDDNVSRVRSPKLLHNLLKRWNHKKIISLLHKKVFHFKETPNVLLNRDIKMGNIRRGNYINTKFHKGEKPTVSTAIPPLRSALISFRRYHFFNLKIMYESSARFFRRRKIKAKLVELLKIQKEKRKKKKKTNKKMVLVKSEHKNNCSPFREKKSTFNDHLHIFEKTHKEEQSSCNTNEEETFVRVITEKYSRGNVAYVGKSPIKREDNMVKPFANASTNLRRKEGNKKYLSLSNVKEEEGCCVPYDVNEKSTSSHIIESYINNNCDPFANDNYINVDEDSFAINESIKVLIQNCNHIFKNNMKNNVLYDFPEMGGLSNVSNGSDSGGVSISALAELAQKPNWGRRKCLEENPPLNAYGSRTNLSAVMYSKFESDAKRHLVDTQFLTFDSCDEEKNTLQKKQDKEGEDVKINSPKNIEKSFSKNMHNIYTPSQEKMSTTYIPYVTPRLYMPCNKSNIPRYTLSKKKHPNHSYDSGTNKEVQIVQNVNLCKNRKEKLILCCTPQTGERRMKRKNKKELFHENNKNNKKEEVAVVNLSESVDELEKTEERETFPGNYFSVSNKFPSCLCLPNTYKRHLIKIKKMNIQRGIITYARIAKRRKIREITTNARIAKKKYRKIINYENSKKRDITTIRDEVVLRKRKKVLTKQRSELEGKKNCSEENTNLFSLKKHITEENLGESKILNSKPDISSKGRFIAHDKCSTCDSAHVSSSYGVGSGRDNDECWEKKSKSFWITPCKEIGNTHSRRNRGTDSYHCGEGIHKEDTPFASPSVVPHRGRCDNHYHREHHVEGALYKSRENSKISEYEPRETSNQESHNMSNRSESSTTMNYSKVEECIDKEIEFITPYLCNRREEKARIHYAKSSSKNERRFASKSVTQGHIMCEMDMGANLRNEECACITIKHKDDKLVGIPVNSSNSIDVDNLNKIDTMKIPHCNSDNLIGKKNEAMSGKETFEKNIQHMNTLIEKIKLKKCKENVYIYFYTKNNVKFFEFNMELGVLGENCILFKNLNLTEGKQCTIKKEDIMRRYGDILSLNGDACSGRSGGSGSGYCISDYSSKSYERVRELIGKSLSLENFLVLFTLLKIKRRTNLFLSEINKIILEICELIVHMDGKLGKIRNLISDLTLFQNKQNSTKFLIIKKLMNFFLQITNIYSNIYSKIKSQISTFSFIQFNHEIANSYLFFIKRFDNYISNSVIDIQSFYKQIKGMHIEVNCRTNLSKQETKFFSFFFNNLIQLINVHYKKILIFKKILDIYLIELKNFKKYQKEYTYSKVNVLFFSKCPYDLLLFSVIIKCKLLCEICIRNICNNFDFNNFEKEKNIYFLFFNKKLKSSILEKIKKIVKQDIYNQLKKIIFYRELNNLMNNSVKTKKTEKDQLYKTYEHKTDIKISHDLLVDNFSDRGKKKNNEKKKKEQEKNGKCSHREQPSYRTNAAEENHYILSNSTANNLSSCSSQNHSEQSRCLQNIDHILKTNSALAFVKSIRRSLNRHTCPLHAQCSVKTKPHESEKPFCAGEKRSCAGEKRSCAGEKRSCAGEKRSCAGEKRSCAGVFPFCYSPLEGRACSKVLQRNEENSAKLDSHKKKEFLTSEIDRLKKTFKQCELKAEKEGESTNKRISTNFRSRKKKKVNKHFNVHNSCENFSKNGKKKSIYLSSYDSREEGVTPKNGHTNQNERRGNENNVAICGKQNCNERSGKMKPKGEWEKSERKKVKIIENIENIKVFEKRYKQLQENKKKEKLKKQLNEMKRTKLTKRNNVNLLKFRGLNNKKKYVFTSFIKNIKGKNVAVKFKINDEDEYCKENSEMHQKLIPHKSRKCAYTKNGSNFLNDKNVKNKKHTFDMSKSLAGERNNVHVSHRQSNKTDITKSSELQNGHSCYISLSKYDSELKKENLNNSDRNKNNDKFEYEKVQSDIMNIMKESSIVVNTVDDGDNPFKKNFSNVKKGYTSSVKRNITHNKKNNEYYLDDHMFFNTSYEEINEPKSSEEHFFFGIPKGKGRGGAVPWLPRVRISPELTKNLPAQPDNRIPSKKIIKYKLSDYSQKFSQFGKDPFLCIP